MLFQGFFLDYQNIFLPEHPFMDHSFQTNYEDPFMKNTLHCLLHIF